MNPSTLSTTSAPCGNPTTNLRALNLTRQSLDSSRAIAAVGRIPWTPILVIGCGLGFAAELVRAALRFPHWAWMVQR